MRLFGRYLLKNVLNLHNDLIKFTYRHANYECFNVCDPKPRIIHKAIVRDRLLHHAIYRVLMPIFDKTFIFDCYSCRKLKGTHRAFQRLTIMARKQSKNYSKTCWALRCDIRKFFHSIDHKILISLLSKRINDEQLINLLREIIESFAVCGDLRAERKSASNANLNNKKGMPLGNLTSQLFANIYLDPLDKFIKHKLKAKYYLRYADDFMLLADDPKILHDCLLKIDSFLSNKLKLSLHPNKITFRKLSWGLDFVGYVAHPKFNLPRKKTIKRIFAKLEKIQESNPEKLNESLQSHLGFLKHVDARLLSQNLNNWFGNR